MRSLRGSLSASLAIRARWPTVTELRRRRGQPRPVTPILQQRGRLPGSGSRRPPPRSVSPRSGPPTSPFGPPLAALSSAEEIREAVEAAHGPTNDIAEELSRFVRLPDRCPPPSGPCSPSCGPTCGPSARTAPATLITAEATFTTDASVDDTLDPVRDGPWATSGLGGRPTARTQTPHGGRRSSTRAVRDPRFGLRPPRFRRSWASPGERRAGHRESALRRGGNPIEESTVHDRLVGWAEGLAPARRGPDHGRRRADQLGGARQPPLTRWS